MLNTRDKFDSCPGKTAYEILPTHKKEGINILLVRRERKISQKKLANAVGLSQICISRIEAGNRRLDYAEIAKIAHFLKVQISVISPPP